MLYFTLITFIFVGATKEMIVFFKRKTRKLNKKRSNWSYTHMLSINKYSAGQKDTAKKSSNYAVQWRFIKNSHQNRVIKTLNSAVAMNTGLLIIISLAWMFTDSHLSWKYLLTVICRVLKEHFWIETWMHPINSQAKSSVILISAGNEWSKNSENSNNHYLTDNLTGSLTLPG